MQWGFNFPHLIWLAIIPFWLIDAISVPTLCDKGASSMILSPQFWEWFYIWLVQVVKILYDESAMVALRGGNCAGSSHVCGGARAADAPGAGGAAPPLPMQHLLQPVNNVSVHLYNNSASPLKHDQPSTRYSNPNCMPSHHYRLLAQASKSAALSTSLSVCYGLFLSLCWLTWHNVLSYFLYCPRL